MTFGPDSSRQGQRRSRGIHGYAIIVQKLKKESERKMEKLGKGIKEKWKSVKRMNGKVLK
jgi:hypothetical protein